MLMSAEQLRIREFFSWQPGAGCFRRLKRREDIFRGSSNLCKPCRSSDRWTAALYSHTGRDGAAGAGSGRDVRGIRWTDEWKCRDRTEHGMNAQVQQDNRININTADEAQLTTLTGIGATRAQAIIAYREENGPFAAIEDIMNVQGIKEGTFAKIKDEIVVG